MYSHGNARNDHSVLHYGFLDRSRWEHPRVCCSDLDGADLWNCSADDRDFRDLGATEDSERVLAMRRSRGEAGKPCAESKKKQATTFPENRRIPLFCSVLPPQPLSRQFTHLK